jgi:hypothetical protein
MSQQRDKPAHVAVAWYAKGGREVFGLRLELGMLGLFGAFVTGLFVAGAYLAARLVQAGVIPH